MKSPMKSLLLLILFLIGIIFETGFAVDGVAVTTKNGSREVQYYGYVDGELWRHDIKNDIVTEHTKLFNGPASWPVINPAGTHVAFVKGSKISIIPIGGGSVTELSTGHQNSVLDFVLDDWVYYTMGSYHETRPVRR